MRIPKRLQPLIDEGLVDEVIRPITSGKEAEVFVVRCHGALRAAKVYKEATQRTFKNRADYLDGRALRGSRGERARARGGKFAKEQEEDAWQTAELIALGKLVAAGVRVPQPRGFMDGVLLMDLVLTIEGHPAPRIADCHFTTDEARTLFESLMHEVQRMLCVGIVHGDLSEYNVLLSAYGPVIIDLPQMVDAAASNVARKLLIRDVGNLRNFCGKFAPDLNRSRFAEEMWALYERAQLTPETRLTGQWRDSTRQADVEHVRHAIAEAERDRPRDTRAPRTSGGPGGPPRQAQGGRGPRPPERQGNPRGPGPAGGSPAGGWGGAAPGRPPPPALRTSPNPHRHDPLPPRTGPAAGAPPGDRSQRPAAPARPGPPPQRQPQRPPGPDRHRPRR